MYGGNSAHGQSGANDLNGSSNYGLGQSTATPAWLFPVIVWRVRPGK